MRGEGDMFARQEAVIIEELAPTIDWSRAKCRDGAATMLGLFFSEQLDDIAQAKRICQICPLMEECLAGALARREPWGVWGGQLFQNGKVLAFKRKRGRPPKNPTERDQLTA
jgi:WhiB family redox-sensing transcriptional regulator